MDLSKFEALNLDERDFIVDPDAQNICFFPLPIFTRISEMLSPSDFYNLAQTCRYMHWRMFKYGHLMLKHHMMLLDNPTSFDAFGKPHILEVESIIHRPYVYVEYLHLDLDFEYRFLKSDLDRYSSSMFDKVIDYESKAKKRIKHYCLNIYYEPAPQQVCTQQTFQAINNLIERINPFHLELWLPCDRKLSVEIPHIKNINSVYFLGFGDSRETDVLMNPCARYGVYTLQDLRDSVQEFIKNSRLQSHIYDFMDDFECRAMLEKEWNLKFKEADETLKNHRDFPKSRVTHHASIPSEHGDVEIFIANDFIVIEKKETYIGQWEDFYRNVRLIY